MDAGIIKENVLAVQAQRKAEAERDAALKEAAQYRAERDELADLVKFYRRMYNNHYDRYISDETASNRRRRELLGEIGVAALVVLALLGVTVLVWNVTLACWL